MSESSTPSQVQNHTLVLPPFLKAPALSIDMGNIREAERRLIEAKTVNPITYADLEHCFNEAYRDLKKHLSAVGFQISLAEKFMKEAKANIILDRYPEYLKTNDIKATQNNADLREAFIMRDSEYIAALDRFNQLKALESNLDGKIKVMENVCRYMRKQMDLVIRSGLSGSNLYNTIGAKNGK